MTEVNRRYFLSFAGLAATALPARRAAAAAKAGISEEYSLTVCPWTPENPRHDHQLIFPMRDGSLMLVWCEYYVRKPSRIFRTPYSAAGFRDDAPCRISAKISKDGGRSWSGKITLQENFGSDNVKHPNLLRLPSGEILFSFTVRDMAKRDLRIYLKRSTDECETWTTPLQISPPGGVYYTNADHNLLHRSGRVILPLHYWDSVRQEKPHYQAFCLYSDDEGKNWQASRKGADLPMAGAEEPGVVERKDGALLAMLRTSLGKIYRSVSTDRGETWSDAEPTALPSPNVANCIKRIPQTGDLLFLWNNVKPYSETRPGSTERGRPRNPLCSAISRDEGETWENIKTIEDRRGYDNAYPSVTFVGDEALIAFYRRSENMARDTDVALKIFSTDWFYS